MHISLAAEEILHLPFLTVSNSLVTSLAVSLLIFAVVWFLKKKINPLPGAVQGAVEIAIEAVLNLLESISGAEKARKFFPLCFTLLLFIVLNNWAGLIPGVGSIGFWEDGAHGPVLVPFLRGGTADLNTTLALALVSVAAIQYFGLSSLKLGYLKKFFNFSNPINFFVGILELISEFAKIVSFAFRLFGNIFAGEVLLTVIAFLIPIIAPLPFYGLEIFVGLIQALVFMMLTAVFLNVATAQHE